MLQHESKKVPIFIHEEREKKWGRIWEEQTEKETIPVYVSWHLNERYYGRLQGLNKQQTKDQYGEEQVQLWRRSFSTPPPDGESLEMTAKRTLPFFEEKIMPFLEEGKNVLVSAHGNSLRSIVMKIEGLSQEEILLLEIPTGIPLSYFFRDRTFHREI
jgi:2,3-bisphosphoglycerate-dependent phosphoglycerate mutase